MDNPARTELFDNSPFMTAWERTIGGDRFTYVRVGQGVSVIPIRRNAHKALELTLIHEPRLETPLPILKAIGGYLRGHTEIQMAHQLLMKEAGMVCRELRLLIPRMEGFTVVELPIATYLALGYQIVQPTTTTESTTEPYNIELPELVELVLAQRIPDQCTADAIMRLALLEARNRLPI